MIRLYTHRTIVTVHIVLYGLLFILSIKVLYSHNLWFLLIRKYCLVSTYILWLKYAFVVDNKQHTHTHTHTHQHKQNELNGLSQYNETAYYPNTDVYFNTIQAKVQEFFNANIKEALRELENYIIDFYVTPEKVRGQLINDKIGFFHCRYKC